MNCKLNDICQFVKDSIPYYSCNSDTYVSTECMIPNKGGVDACANTPSSGTVCLYGPGDVLISNIRPYFKKIWFADCQGTCSNDVLVFRADEKMCSSKYMYYLLSNDVFFEYVMSTSKGTKMPRGDKNAVMDYKIDLPDLKKQEATVWLLSRIDLKIQINSYINDYLVA